MKLIIEISNVVLPVLLLIAFGYGASKLGMITDGFTEAINPLLFRVFMPINVFNNIYNVTGFNVLDPMVVVLVSLIYIFIMGFTAFILKGTSLDKEEKSITVNGMIRSNIIIFGLALAQNYFDPYRVGIVTLYIVLISVIRDIFSVFIFEYYLRTGKGIDVKEFAKSVITSPMLLGSVAGLAFVISGLSMPQVLAKPISQIASVTAPIGLMTVGAALKIDREDADKNIVMLGSVLKGVVIPAVSLILGVVLGFRGPELFVLVVLFATPIAVSSYPMAEEYTDNGQLAAKLVVYSTLINGFTVFISLLVLAFFSWI